MCYIKYLLAVLICEISIVGNTKVKKNTIDLGEIDEGIMNSISDQINCSKNGNLSIMVDVNETNCNISSVNETWMSNTTINSEPSVSCYLQHLRGVRNIKNM